MKEVRFDEQCSDLQSIVNDAVYHGILTDGEKHSSDELNEDLKQRLCQNGYDEKDFERVEQTMQRILKQAVLHGPVREICSTTTDKYFLIPYYLLNHH